MERKIHFYSTLILGFPVLMSIEGIVIQVVNGSPIRYVNLYSICLDVIVGISSALVTSWIDPGYKRVIWLIPAYVISFSLIAYAVEAAPVLRSQSPIVSAIDFALNGATWGLTALVITMAARAISKPKPTGKGQNRWE